MIQWDLVWSPEGRIIARVEAVSAKAAVRKTPLPFRRFKGEVYARRVNEPPTTPALTFENWRTT